eukprot:g2782.t1
MCRQKRSCLLIETPPGGAYAFHSETLYVFAPNEVARFSPAGYLRPGRYVLPRVACPQARPYPLGPDCEFFKRAPAVNHEAARSGKRSGTCDGTAEVQAGQQDEGDPFGPINIGTGLLDALHRAHEGERASSSPGLYRQQIPGTQ